MQLMTVYFVGVIFGVGISISGMANPAKVLNFFDVAGTWDPSLAFVMGGALSVTVIGYHVVLKRPVPILGAQFHLPSSQKLDLPLIDGLALFGVGWGIAGFCPGGALPAIGTGKAEVLIFVAALLAGIFLAKVFLVPLVARLAASA